MQKNTPEIRKNTIGKNNHKIMKKLKNWKNTLKIQENTNENLKNGPHLILVKKSGKCREKYSGNPERL